MIFVPSVTVVPDAQPDQADAWRAVLSANPAALLQTIKQRAV